MDGSEALMKNNEKKKIHTLNGGEATKKQLMCITHITQKFHTFWEFVGKREKGNKCNTHVINTRERALVCV